MDRRPITELPRRTVADVVAEDYTRAAVFRRFGIDFCCGGRRTVAEACERAGVAPDELAEALASAARSGRAWPDPSGWEAARLAEHIVEEHHGYVRETLPALDHFAEKVARVHGDTHPELHEIRALVAELAGELERHMTEEETDLFPRVAALETAGPADASPAAADLEAVVTALEDDHDRAGAILGRIRELSGGFTPPEGACATYRATYAKLEELEEDLHRHVHLENNVLFPRVAELVREGGETATRTA